MIILSRELRDGTFYSTTKISIITLHYRVFRERLQIMIRVVDMLMSMKEIRERDELVMDIAAVFRTFLIRSELERTTN